MLHSTARHCQQAGRPAYAKLEILEAGIRIRDEGLTPGIPEGTPDFLADIMKKCWQKVRSQSQRILLGTNAVFNCRAQPIGQRWNTFANCSEQITIPTMNLPLRRVKQTHSCILLIISEH